MHRILGLATLFLTIFAQPAYAAMPAKDLIPGAKDHPMVSRYQGAIMVGYDMKTFEEAQLPLGKRTRNKEGKSVFEKVIPLEGKYTRIAYDYPADRSSLEVMRNYETALRTGGFTTLFSCAKESCGPEFGEYILSRVDNNFIHGTDWWSPFNYGRSEPRAIVARGVASDGAPVHVAVYVVPPKEKYNGGIYLEVVESKKMEEGKVSAKLTANDMAKGLATEGKIAVYGVYFDTAKADIKPESKDALDEMAALLRQQAHLKVFVVGHTDNQGSLGANIELSQKRADSVVKSLADNYKIDSKRMLARGVASFAPITSNDSDDGRAKNRRVELVKQ